MKLVDLRPPNKFKNPEFITPLTSKGKRVMINHSK